MTDENYHRDDPPGITPIPHRRLPPGITSWETETTALHSRSRGWLPALAITITTADGAGATGVIEIDDAWLDILDGLIAATERAPLDVAAGIADGTLDRMLP